MIEDLFDLIGGRITIKAATELFYVVRVAADRTPDPLPKRNHQFR